ncbi:hypothetical protein KSP40_PGU003697 [Platanthera guangdongensis]|uniref:Uncharacterized protein n=1 Tax=Platanthera guangdongensis TaxID=2320717 RepID=A0ABR2LEF2_9ASPA
MEGNGGWTFRIRRRKQSHPRSSFHNPVKEATKEQDIHQVPASGPPPVPSPETMVTTAAASTSPPPRGSSARAKKASFRNSSNPGNSRGSERATLAAGNPDISCNESSAERENGLPDTEEPPAAAARRRKLQNV